MSTRYRWYRVRCPRGVSLVETLDSLPYREDGEHGFLRLDGGSSSADFRFIWKNEVVVTEFKENSEPQYSRIRSVSFADFSCISKGGALFLRLINPARDTRPLLNAIESVLGLGFTAHLLTFDKSPPAAVFKGVDATNLVSIKLVGAVIREDLLARIDLVSKQGIALDKIALLKGLEYRISAASYELQYRALKGTLSYSSSGIVKLSGPLAPRLLSLLEVDLLTANRKS